MGLKIIGTGRAIPVRSVSNDELATFLDTSDEWITSHTGIRNRYVCTTESLTDLAESAARSALAKSDTDAAELDLIICATVSGDYILPSLACCVAERLGTKCPAFDISVSCAGFVYALDIADAYLSSGKAKRVLIVCADKLSRLLDWSDRSTCVLFGDGAGACVMAEGSALKYSRIIATGNPKPLRMENFRPDNPFTDGGTQAPPLGYVSMAGQEVFKYAVQTVEREVKLALDTLGLDAEAIDYYLLHQANKRIIDSARTRLKQPEDKFPINIDRYSNINAATIPVLLDEMLEEGRIAKGNMLLFIAFGAGLAAGTCVIEWE